jgi:hypothetical protein
VIRFASERGLKVTGQSTGHAAVPLGPLDETILIKTEDGMIRASHNV